MRTLALYLLLSPVTLLTPVLAQSSGAPGDSSPKMTFEEYEPVSTLDVPAHPLTRSKFPFIDVHAHQYRAAGAGTEEIGELVRAMDEMNMAVMVNLSGGSGERFVKMQQALVGRHPQRFVNFANIDFDGIDDPDWAERTVAQLERDVEAGAVGLKIYKNLGMFVRDSSGRVQTDDPRIDPVWAKCGELGIPVLIHTGEPSPFWLPHDRYNERWLELKQRPNRKRDDASRFASFEQTMGEQHNIFRKHPDTIFINAHLGWLGNDLGRLGRLMDELPNMYTEIGAVLAELGRQPRFARQFLIDHQNRVLFGKDSWNPEEYHVYFRTLETADEYFDYYRRRHAHWKMYGLDLPDEVLKKIYYQNALRIIPGIDGSLFPQ